RFSTSFPWSTSVPRCRNLAASPARRQQALNTRSSRLRDRWPPARSTTRRPSLRCFSGGCRGSEAFCIIVLSSLSGRSNGPPDLNRITAILQMPLRDHFRPPLDQTASWEGFHCGWPMVVVQQLRTLLPPGYVAEPRVHSGSQVEIDVAAFESHR